MSVSNIYQLERAFTIFTWTSCNSGYRCHDIDQLVCAFLLKRVVRSILGIELKDDLIGKFKVFE